MRKGEHQICGRKCRKFQSPDGQKRKILLEEAVINSVQALLQRYNKTEENEERKRYGIYFFLKINEKAQAIE